MSKGGPKVCPIEIALLGRAWVEYFMTFGAKDIHGVIPWQVGQSHGKHSLAVAVDARTPAKVIILELLQLLQ